MVAIAVVAGVAIIVACRSGGRNSGIRRDEAKTMAAAASPWQQREDKVR